MKIKAEVNIRGSNYTLEIEPHETAEDIKKAIAELDDTNVHTGNQVKIQH